MFYLCEPEVSGGFGEDSILNTEIHPPKISKLHIAFDGWLGDDLLEIFPCFLVSEHLKSKLEDSQLTGFKFDSLIVTKSEQFNDLFSNKILPKFYWFKVFGKAQVDDFGISDNYILTISDKALDVLKIFHMKSADIEEIA